MDTLYRHIIKDAFRMAIKNPILWFFGIFAAIVTSAGQFNFVAQNMPFYKSTFSDFWVGLIQIYYQTGLNKVSILKNFGKMIIQEPTASFGLLAVLIIFIAVVFFIIWLIMVSQGSLIFGANAIGQEKRPDFNSLLRAGKAKFWPILGFNAIFKTLSALLAAIVSMFLFAATVKTIWGLVMFLTVFIITSIIAIILSLILKFALCYNVLENKSFVQSFNNALTLFKKYWLISVEMAFIIFLVSLLIGFLVALIAALLILPFMLLVYLTISLQFFIGLLLTVVLGFILILGFIVWSGAVLAAWEMSAWTLLFNRLTSEGGVSKIVRVAQKVWR